MAFVTPLLAGDMCRRRTGTVLLHDNTTPPRISLSCFLPRGIRAQSAADAAAAACAGAVVARRRRRLRGLVPATAATPPPPRIRMQAVPTGPPRSEGDPVEAEAGDTALPAAGVKTKAQEKEESVEQTWWGLAWFVVIIAIMSLGIVATLARDFVPGGLGPAI